MIRVRITRAEGSTPREAGAEMMVGADRTEGSIGGGQLEYMAIDRARQMLRQGEAEADMDVPLGPAIGQCCGGRVWLRLDRGKPAPPDMLGDVLIFGAGHVGRALARALKPLPLRAVLIDQRQAELDMAEGARTVLSPLPEAELRTARPGSAAVIATHDHALDFLLAAEALRRADLAYVGMIGSASKRARFSRYARDQGLDPAPLICPIGAGYSADKRPEIIAAFTAAEIVGALTSSPVRKYSCST
ncbi:MAG: xanthine dehydrogenase accessory protein XdhC [Paracoccus sp. (in: a-proteobacteria)]|nr:xanthine dehydrogenase accessory protein XdhC [Paracoccus sp. (in: a-proteobacteria)]